MREHCDEDVPVQNDALSPPGAVNATLASESRKIIGTHLVSGASSFSIVFQGLGAKRGPYRTEGQEEWKEDVRRPISSCR